MARRRKNSVSESEAPAGPPPDCAAQDGAVAHLRTVVATAEAELETARRRLATAEKALDDCQKGI